jgi:BirA family biotin operon repressor/biotin-[acetyl-CoA-carboxylase] ligase
MPKPTEFHEAMAAALTGISPRAVTLDTTRSTNDDARALARDGALHLTVVTAQHQTGGRGRRDRTWHAEPGKSLLATWVVRPSLPAERWTLLPLLAGVATVEAVRARTRVEAVLKWPNDLMVAERKLGGILAEAEPPAFAIVGLGLNVSQQDWPEGLNATSLAREDAVRLDRADLLAEVLRRFDAALGDLEGSMTRYRDLCVTLGRTVRVERTGAPPLEGVATDVDARGALVVDGVAIAAGDVAHVR